MYTNVKIYPKKEATYMARKEVTQFFDDLSGSPLSEEEVQSVIFGVDNGTYIIDLSEENAEKFRETLQPYIQVARKHIAPTQKIRRTRGVTANGRAREIRQWAIDQGKEISMRGKIPTEIIEAYNAAYK
ncbi:Lsr2 family protein [Corynebacterium mastitidis]|uniref:Lsr2 family protein n=1 Tax=Corynebacterium mastitidis TaxID=161890 RepID=A0ABU8NZZ5_9CORY